MRVDQFDFELPEDLIALRPARPRDAARLLVVDPATGCRHASVRDLPSLLRAGDVLVFNDTKVIPAALSGVRTREGGQTARVSVNLIERLDASQWRALARPSKRLKPGDRIEFGEEANVCLIGALAATVAGRGDEGEIVLAFDMAGPALDEAIGAHGRMPLPPYIAGRRAPDEADRADYQTMFATCEGAVAAPTAGLHFTPDLMQALADRDIATETITLHVGAGTFLPVKADDTEQHRMHPEQGEIAAETSARLNARREAGGRILAVGTTSLRLLESAADATGRVRSYAGETDIFITPGYRFRAVDMLMTNFHLPRSTLFMLVSAFSGLETIRGAYAKAINERYRFYSYGDACLLFPTRNDKWTMI